MAAIKDKGIVQVLGDGDTSITQMGAVQEVTSSNTSAPVSSNTATNQSTAVIEASSNVSTTPTRSAPKTHRRTTSGSNGEGSETITETTTNPYNTVVDALGQKPEYTPSTDKSAGAGAADGTMYSWDKQGIDAAQNQYQQDTLKAKQDALANRQTIEQNSLQYQQQADMMQYANNQNAEKVGWTGGYVLDQNRQMEYLKSSIQAQMYGAMELQKYGYDSALAAARLSYDLNQKEFAHKYYQDAVNIAITEANLTGTYFSAETRDMMSQLSAANQELKEFAATDIDEIDVTKLTQEQQRALEVKKNIESWYKANGVNTAGLKTLAAWQTEQSMAQEWAMNQWEMYQAALSAAENKVLEKSDVVIELDEKGNPVYEGGTIKTKDFSTMSQQDIVDYASSGSQAKSQVAGYVDNLFEKTVTQEITTSQTYTNENGEKVPIINEEKLKEALLNNEDAKEIAKALGTYTYSTEAGGIAIDITLDDKEEIKIETKSSKDQQNKQEEQQVISEYQQTINDYNAGKTNVISFTAITKGNDKLNTYGMKVQEGAIGDSGLIDDDMDIDIGGKNYDLDIDWAGRTGNEGKGMSVTNFNNTVGYLKEAYPSQSKDELVIYNGRVWFYSEKQGKWGLVQTNVGGNKLLKDLQEAVKGTEPQRWK